jgi:RNA polymerase sigma-70 factor (ECF subfamily)
MTDSGQRGEEATDAELIAAWKAGDQRAAARLVERHADALARFAAAGGDWEGTDIEELVQDTFVRAFGSIDGFRGESSLRTWLISIERRLMLDRRRAERRRQREQPVNEDAAVTEYDPLDDLMARETAARVRRALAALSPTQRDVFVLRVNEGLSYREIARVVDTTEGAARVHYHNAMHAIKEFLDD